MLPGDLVIVRLTADNPLLDPLHIQRVVADVRLGMGYSAVLDPPGMDAEAFTWAMLELAWRNARSPYDREHVTPWILRHAQSTRVTTPTSLVPWLSVDTPEDLDRVRKVHAALKDPTNFSVSATMEAWREAGRP